MARIPVFARGHVGLWKGKDKYEYLNCNISAFGTGGLAWKGFSFANDFGSSFKCDIRLLGDEHLRIFGEASILREQSLRSSLMGLRFKLSAGDQARLEGAIQKSGHYPNSYLRKYPRIPARQDIGTFPLLANVQMLSTERFRKDPPLAVRVQNLAPSGLLFSSENGTIFSVGPGEKIAVTLQARGWFDSSVPIVATIARTTDEQNPESGNLTRYVGARFEGLREEDKKNFKRLLLEIVEELKGQ
jgi:hypothetical protein